MRTELKIGIILGIVVVIAVVALFVMKDGQQGQLPDTAPPPPPSTKVPEPKEPGLTTPPSRPLPSPPTVVVTPPTRKELPEPCAPAPVVAPAVKPMVRPEPPESTRKPRYHTVVAGDTLSKIAEQFYGHGRFWKVIHKANESIIKKPNELKLGWKLRIPYPEEVAEEQN